MANKIGRPRIDDPDKAKGLYRKFDVTRHDPNNKHRNCFYFVLDMDHDQLAVPALAAYILAADEAGYTALASDLRGILKMAQIKFSGGNG